MNGQETPQTETVRAQDLQQGVPERTKPDYALLARLVVRDGKPFKSSAIEAGYSESVASGGLRALMADSNPASEAIRAEEKRLSVSMDRLKPLAINRLYHEILNMQSSNGMKAIELAGKFKETDWFVRQSETNLGILINMSDTISPPDSPVIDVSQE